MKKLMIASAIAMVCLSANAFAEDDGYGNDIPPARSEGTVDDGYGNKLPANNEPEYKSFEEARASSYGSTSNSGNNNARPRAVVGMHLGIGYASLANFPSDNDFVTQYGKNDWSGLSLDFGLAFKYRINNLITFAPELNFGLNYITEEIEGAGGWDYFYGEYKVDDARTLYSVNIPLMLRLNVPFAYIEGGIRLNFNIDTDHEYEYTDRDGNPLKYYDYEDEEYKTVKRDAKDDWEVKTFVPSVVAGLGTTILINGHECDFGVRFIWDLSGIEKKQNKIVRIYETERSSIVKVVEDNTNMYAIQFVFNYFF